MKVEGIQSSNPIVPPEKINDKDKASNPKGKNMEAAAVYEKSKPEDKTHVYDKLSIEKLKQDSEKAYATLRQIVENLLKRQGKTLDILQLDDVVQVDETARIEARQLIGANGPLGVEAVSDRIVNFAKAVSGGDKSKLDKLRSAIDKGFKEAEKILGQLPEISRKTYDRIMEKLDAWEEE